METVVVLFTRDLRVHDNPALAGACRAAAKVVPLFVLDPSVPSSPNRTRFLAESLADLRDALRQRGGDLLIRRGDPVDEAMTLARRVGAQGIALTEDVSGYARRRQDRLAKACAEERISLKLFPGVTILPHDALKPYKVFTPYWRAWLAQDRRAVEDAPRKINLPADLPSGDLPAPLGKGSPEVLPGGEVAARKRLSGWVNRVGGYDAVHDDMAADGTSRLSPYLHFGCVSPREVAAHVEGRGGADPFVRQLCWRDFYQQLLAGCPQLPYRNFRASASDNWRDHGDALAAWTDGYTGVPIVDAGMRQLAREGWIHNRARLITASFLTKHLGIDWRAGAAHFAVLLLDADVANNNGNWQWVAGTGTDTKPYRRFNPIRQAERYDPDGAYVRRYLPELAGVKGGDVHQPWKLSGVDYPRPLEGIEPTTWLPSAG
jgi:deoxyribodipyrimidine photo-lyase